MPDKESETPAPPRELTPGELLAQIIQGDDSKEEEFIEASKKALGPACTNFTITRFDQ